MSDQDNPAQIIQRVDHERLYLQGKEKWLRSSNHRNIEALFDDIVTLILGLAFIAAFSLAAAHTVEAFSFNTTAGVTGAAPILLEAGFVALTWKNRGIGRFGWLMALLLASVSILANLFIGLEYAERTASDATMARWQFFALVVAPIPPLMTAYLGQRLPEILKERPHRRLLNEAWARDEYTVIKRAFMNEYIRLGIPPRQAGQFAQSMAARYVTVTGVTTVTSPSPEALSQPSPNEIPAISTPSRLPTTERAEPVTSLNVKTCAFPGCDVIVTGGNKYCSERHANADRQRRYRERRGKG